MRLANAKEPNRTGENKECMAEVMGGDFVAVQLAIGMKQPCCYQKFSYMSAEKAKSKKSSKCINLIKNNQFQVLIDKHSLHKITKK